MLVSDGKDHSKFAFIHIQKTGGASISDLIKTTVPGATSYGPRHMFASQAAERVDDWEGHFKFAFVRNPWDRLVSWYSMINNARVRDSEGQATKTQRRRIDKHPLWRYVVENSETFEDFIKNCTDEVEIRDGYFYSFAYNQLDYITDKNGEVMVDFIGRFENFADDLIAVFNKVGLDANEIPHKNRSPHDHYSTLYTPETEQIVRERFRRDIEYFGYEFENARAAEGS